MKNKPIVISLIIAVALIWGNVIYKFIKNLGVEDEDWNASSTVHEDLVIPSPDELDFQLMLNYKDPFLISRKKTSHSKSNDEIVLEKAFEEVINPSPSNGRVTSVQRSSSVRNNFGSTSVNNQNKKRVRPYQWPDISYHGVVKKQGTQNSGLLMIKFNNAIINIRQGEYFYDDLKITRSWRDSVEIINERMETKIFYR